MPGAETIAAFAAALFMLENDDGALFGRNILMRANFAAAGKDDGKTVCGHGFFLSDRRSDAGPVGQGMGCKRIGLPAVSHRVLPEQRLLLLKWRAIRFLLGLGAMESGE